MTAILDNRLPVQVPAGGTKKARAAKKRPEGFFGLLPDWKIDTQALKDELRE